MSQKKTTTRQTTKRRTTAAPKEQVVHEHFSPAELVAKMKPEKVKVRAVKVAHPTTRLRELRQQVGLTLAVVSAGMGPIRKLSHAAICDAEHGGEVVLSTALALSRFYGKTIEEIW